MRFLLPFALAASLVPMAASAQTVVVPRKAHLHRLPPVSGTIAVPREAFGGGYRQVPAWRLSRRPEPMPRVVTGGLWPARRIAVAPFQPYGGGYRPIEPWMTGGTGLSGVIGNTGNPFAGQAAWGTADSATTGRGLFTNGWGHERPLASGYGETPIDPTGSGYTAYGASPQLGFYGSGTPYSIAYYSSGSSAGPYGSPGGLATYRSGSYGYGPRVLMVPGGGYGRQTCSCGPRIVRVGRRVRSDMVD